MVQNSIRLFIIAGEASGDVLGGKLLQNIKNEIKNNPDFNNKNLEIRGIGSTNIEKQGLKSIFDMSELSLMGFLKLYHTSPD